MRCRTKFTTLNRKHHCRNCGLTFCQDCSSKKHELPHFGIYDDVRVCDGCYDKLSKKNEDGSGSNAAKSDSTEDLDRQEEEDLERAIAASLETTSLNEASSKSKKSKKKASKKQVSFKEETASANEEEEDEDLKAAIAASLKESREQEKKKASLSYPSVSATTSTYVKQPIYGQESSYLEPVIPASSPAQVKVLTALDQLSDRELENLALFSELVEKTDAEIALRGIHTLNISQLQVYYIYSNENENTYNQVIGSQTKLVSALAEVDSKYRYFSDLNQRLTNAVKAYEQLLQSKLANVPAASSYYGNANYYSAPQPPPSQQPYYTDHGYALPPTPVQSTYGDFYQHRMNEIAPPPTTSYYTDPHMAAPQVSEHQHYQGQYVAYGRQESNAYPVQPETQEEKPLIEF